MSVHQDAYPCVLCSEHFPNQHEQADHLENVHYYVFSYLCYECPHGCMEDDELQKHMRSAHPDSVHEDNEEKKPSYECPLPGCSYRFCSPDMQLRHKKHDHSEQSIRAGRGLGRGCVKPGCSYTNDSYIAMSLHVLQQHAPTCPGCKLKFAKATEVIDHRSTCSELKKRKREEILNEDAEGGHAGKKTMTLDESKKRFFGDRDALLPAAYQFIEDAAKVTAKAQEQAQVKAPAETPAKMLTKPAPMKGAAALSAPRPPKRTAEGTPKCQQTSTLILATKPLQQGLQASKPGVLSHPTVAQQPPAKRVKTAYPPHQQQVNAVSNQTISQPLQAEQHGRQVQLPASDHLPYPAAHPTSTTQQHVLNKSKCDELALPAAVMQPQWQQQPDLPRDMFSPPAPRAYRHCSIGDVLTASELASHAQKAEEADQARMSKIQQPSPATSTSTSQQNASSTNSALRGFDRFLAAGYTPAEVAAGRTDFLALQELIHTSDTMPTGPALLALEDGCVDNTLCSFGVGEAGAGSDAGCSYAGGARGLEDTFPAHMPSTCQDVGLSQLQHSDTATDQFSKPSVEIQEWSEDDWEFFNKLCEEQTSQAQAAQRYEHEAPPQQQCGASVVAAEYPQPKQYPSWNERTGVSAPVAPGAPTQILQDPPMASRVFPSKLDVYSPPCTPGPPLCYPPPNQVLSTLQPTEHGPRPLKQQTEYDMAAIPRFPPKQSYGYHLSPYSPASGFESTTVVQYAGYPTPDTSPPQQAYVAPYSPTQPRKESTAWTPWPPLPPSAYIQGWEDRDFNPATNHMDKHVNKRNHRTFPDDLQDEHIFNANPKYIAHDNFLRLAKKYTNTQIYEQVNQHRPGKAFQSVGAVDGRLQGALKWAADEWGWRGGLDQVKVWLDAERKRSGLLVRGTRKRAREDEHTPADPALSPPGRALATPNKRRKTAGSQPGPRRSVPSNKHNLMGDFWQQRVKNDTSKSHNLVIQEADVDEIERQLNME